MPTERPMKAEIRTITTGEAQAFLPSVLEGGGSVPLTVTGNSMLPFLKDKRDTVWLRETDKPKRGQILLFRRQDGSFILHRLRRIRRDGTLVMNGDAQSWCEIISPDQVLACVTAFSRPGKKTVSADGFPVRLRDLLWYPTRPIRPFLFRTYLAIRRLTVR